MKKIYMTVLIALATPFGSAFANPPNYAFECYGMAVSAAKAIDALNFGSDDQASIQIDAEVQKELEARIIVSIGSDKNRRYSISLHKNRSASLQGDHVTTEPGCFVESVN